MTCSRTGRSRCAVAVGHSAGSLSLSLSLWEIRFPQRLGRLERAVFSFFLDGTISNGRGEVLFVLSRLCASIRRDLFLFLFLFLFLSLSLSLGEMLTTNALSFCLSRTATRMPTVGEDEESSSGNYRLDFQSSHSVIRGRLHDYHEELQQIQHAKLIRQVAVRSPALDSAEVLVRRKRRTGRANEFS